MCPIDHVSNWPCAHVPNWPCAHVLNWPCAQLTMCPIDRVPNWPCVNVPMCLCPQGRAPMSTVAQFPNYPIAQVTNCPQVPNTPKLIYLWRCYVCKVNWGQHYLPFTTCNLIQSALFSGMGVHKTTTPVIKKWPSKKLVWDFIRDSS